MGWGRFLLLGDLGQQLDLSDQTAEIQRQKAELERLRNNVYGNRNSAPDTSTEVWKLRNDNDELKLYLAALVRILISKNVIDTEEFRRIVETIDAEDGSTDGKFEGRIC